ncbi:MAG: nucleotidyltransferase domain-containing protein [Thermoanaerobaculia bacterium]|nr:nucleotidyltransferase domain-containing protein [Thermoanaerobaculia bacterium]MCZ7652273.1 nucleotidyltransferase domain-containing protein [Thermoanaerobaculia bacterium]
MYPAVEDLRPQLERICRRFGVRRLELFGSASRGGFEPGRSDVDLLFELDPPPGIAYTDAFFGLREALEQLFGAPVDLVALGSLRNPHFLAAIAPTRQLLYAA